MSIQRRTQASKLYRQGVTNEEFGKFEIALRKYLDAINLDKKFILPYLNLGFLCSRAGENKIALQCYLKAKDIEDGLLVNFNLAVNYFQLRRWAQCESSLQNCLLFDKSFLRAHLLIGYLHQSLGNYQKSSNAYRKVLQLEDDNRIAYLGLISNALHRGEDHEAIRSIDNYFRKIEVEPSLQKCREFLKDRLISYASYPYLKEKIQSDESYRAFSDYIQKITESSKGQFKEFFAEVATKLKQSEETADISRLNKKQLFEKSLYHLFNGETRQAIQALFDSKKAH